MHIKTGGTITSSPRTLGPAFRRSHQPQLFSGSIRLGRLYCIGFGGARPHCSGTEAATAPSSPPSFLSGLSFWSGRREPGLPLSVRGYGLARGGSGLFPRCLRAFDAATLASNWFVNKGMPFWVAFALFPAVTGFTQGVSLSGEAEGCLPKYSTRAFWRLGCLPLCAFGTAILLAQWLVRRATVLGIIEPCGRFPVGLQPSTLAYCSGFLSSRLWRRLWGHKNSACLAGTKILPVTNFFAIASGRSKPGESIARFSALIGLGTTGWGDLKLPASVEIMFSGSPMVCWNFATRFEVCLNSPSFGQAPALSQIHQLAG